MGEIARTFLKHAKSHFSLWALFGSYVIGGSFTTYILARTSQKQEVTWNRWMQAPSVTKTAEHAINHPGKRLRPMSIERSLYVIDTQKNSLLEFVYGDGEYGKR